MFIAGMLLILSLVVVARAQQEIVLAKCVATFGDPVDKNLNLFPVGVEFVLRVSFNSKGRLKEIAIEPKYFFSDAHPEWLESEKRPLLTGKTPQNLVSLIDSIKSLGTLKKKNDWGMITNSTNYRTECYENAVVTFADDWDWYGDPEDEKKIRFIRVDYLSKCKLR